jgi:hypothetical protein
MIEMEDMYVERVPLTGIREPIYNGIPEEDIGNISNIADDINAAKEAQVGKLSVIEDAYIRKFPSLYALKYKPIKSKPMTFESRYNALKNRPWQKAIIDDQHPNKIIEKSRQLGMSELSITEVIWFLDVHPNTKVMYTFPRAAQMNDFSNTRVSPAFRDSEYLKTLLSKEVNNVSTKKVGESYLFMRSSWDSAIGEGADVDEFVADEYDRLKDGVELAFQEGLKSSPYGLMRRFSTPTIPGRGINNLYQKSDQMRYIHTCPHCGYKQFLTADDNIIQVKPNGVNKVTHEVEDGTFIIGCKKCKRELDRWALGEWVATYPSIREMRGYHISQLDATWISADSIMRRAFQYVSKQLFYNYVLGEPYSSTGLIIQEEDIKAAIRLKAKITARTREYAAIVAGIDWNETAYMVVLGVKANGMVDLLGLYLAPMDAARPLMDANYLTAILMAYNPNLIVADSGYGADKNSFMYTRFPQQFYSCYWGTAKNPHSKTRFIDQWNEKAREVTVDKTVKILRVLHLLKNRQIGMYPWCEEMQIIATHAFNTRVQDEEDDGIIYQKAVRIGPDHAISALTYASIAVDRVTNYSIATISQGTTCEFI